MQCQIQHSKYKFCASSPARQTSPMRFGTTPSNCPCGSTLAYDACCGPILRGERPAETAESLMRSRYTAYAVGDVDHVFRSWHPRTRPDDLTLEPGLRWTGLEILGHQAGGLEDEAGTVEFRAAWESDDDTGALHEVSRFARRAGRWCYLDGQLD